MKIFLPSFDCPIGENSVISWGGKIKLQATSCKLQVKRPKLEA
jgi:hypothetical protein